MIVCSCNVISDHEIRHVVVSAEEELSSAAQVYDCLGCSVHCGRCSHSVRRILDERPSFEWSQETTLVLSAQP